MPGCIPGMPMLPGPGGIGIGEGAETSSMRKPHVPQKRKVGGTSLAHDGQRRIAGAADEGANPGENPGTPGGGPIGGGMPGPPGPTAPSGPGCIPPSGGGGMPAIGPEIGTGVGPGAGTPGMGRMPGGGICAVRPGDAIGGDVSAIIVFIIATSPPGFGATVSSAPQPRQNL
jgi:hypothetical protein